ncbi:hypothetical protein AZ002_003295, partial [Citrobacter freundii]
VLVSTVRAVPKRRIQRITRTAKMSTSAGMSV